jgi:hypothetical protein
MYFLHAMNYQNRITTALVAGTSTSSDPAGIRMLRRLAGRQVPAGDTSTPAKVMPVLLPTDGAVSGSTSANEKLPRTRSSAVAFVEASLLISVTQR